MKQELSSLDINYIIIELKKIIGAKIDKIYQPDKSEFLFQMHKTGIGKIIIRILPGSLVYITKHKTPSPQKPYGYCVFLRKYLSNARLIDIKQKEFERIIEFDFETKEKQFRLYVELFTKGNFLLCEENNIIISPLENQVWKDRTLKKGEIYSYPKRELNFLTITKEEFSKLIKLSDKESIVKTLAIDLGLGGKYSEELCLLADIDKNEKNPDSNNLFSASEKLKNTNIKPSIVYENKKVKDVIPFNMLLYKDLKTKTFETFNEALDEVFTEKLIVSKKEIKQKHEDKDIIKAEKVLKAQLKQLKQMEKEAEETQKKGELIFENYKLIEEILSEIKKAREKYSWKEIKEKLKNHKIIKNVNEKEGKITVEL